MLSPFDRSKLKLQRREWQKPDKPNVDIVAAFEGLTQKITRRSGLANLALCPFHEETHPSFAMYPETASYFCFSCGAHGDAFDLIMQLENVDFKEALEIGKRYTK